MRMMDWERCFSDSAASVYKRGVGAFEASHNFSVSKMPAAKGGAVTCSVFSRLKKLMTYQTVFASVYLMDNAG